MITHDAVRKIPGGHMRANQIIDVAPDGRCASSCVLAAFNVTRYSNVQRKPSGYAESREEVIREEHDVKEFLFGKAREAREHGKEEWGKRFEQLAAGELAEAFDLKQLARAIGHRIIVEFFFSTCARSSGSQSRPTVCGSSTCSVTRTNTSS